LPLHEISRFAVQSWQLFDKMASNVRPEAPFERNVPLTNSMFGCANSRPDRPAAGHLGHHMPLHIERINWMPSPPLAPDDGPIDLAHLQRMTLGDDGLEREVLAMFAAQAAVLMDRLVKLPSDIAELAHTLKGSARAIGAFRVADTAEWLETALRDDSDAAEALMALSDALAEARAAIDKRLNRS
jgi:HPt (histidine-containing phosphotransfer) domain-containing protein